MPENENYANLQFIDRVSEALIEFRLAFDAYTANGARVDEVLSFLSENGFGDEVSVGRVNRVAERLVEEGKMVAKNQTYKLTPEGEKEVQQLANLVMKMAPSEVPAPEEVSRGLTPDT